MPSKVDHTHTISIGEYNITIVLEDKRTLNSLIKALEKAKKINVSKIESESPTTEIMKVETPNTFVGWEIQNKGDQVLLKPPESHTRENIELMPDMSVSWNPVLKGSYWNDGMYHFFPKKTKLSAEFTNEDIVENFAKMGAIECVE